MYAVDTKKIGKYQIDIFSDDDPENPRNWDNMGSMICFHKRYNLGDKHNFETALEAIKFLKNKRSRHIVLPLFLYDHSGIRMNTTGFSCPWDSGQVGWIYVTREKVRTEFGCKRISPKMLERVKNYLLNEVEIYDQYLIGDVYGFCITDTEINKEVDTCWGYFGKNECMDEAEHIVNHMIGVEVDG